MESNAELVYRIIPSIKKSVNKELCIRKWTGMSTKYMVEQYNHNHQSVFIQFDTNNKQNDPVVRIFPTYLLGYVNPKPNTQYVILTNNVEWLTYKF